VVLVDTDEERTCEAPETHVFRLGTVIQTHNAISSRTAICHSWKRPSISRFVSCVVNERQDGSLDLNSLPFRPQPVHQTEKYSHGPELFAHAQILGKKFDLYSSALFQTDIEEIRWDDAASHYVVKTNRGDELKARFVIVASGLLARVKLPAVPGVERYASPPLSPEARLTSPLCATALRGNLSILHVGTTNGLAAIAEATLRSCRTRSLRSSAQEPPPLSREYPLLACCI